MFEKTAAKKYSETIAGILYGYCSERKLLLTKSETIQSIISIIVNYENGFPPKPKHIRRTKIVRSEFEWLKQKTR